MTKRVIRILVMFLVAAAMLMPACGPAKYTLDTAVNPENAGTITPAGGKYEAGSEVTLHAEPASGYAFDRWSGDVTETDNSITITMDSDKNVTAHFKTGYTLSTSVNPNGGGIVSPAGATYGEDSEVTLTATATSGYAFNYWGGDASGDDNPITIIMSGNKHLIAYFTRVISDGRVGITLDKVERTSAYPDEFKQTTSPWWVSVEYPTPKTGYDYAIIFLSIRTIKSGYIPAELGDLTERSILIDNKGQRHRSINWSIRGIEYSDLHDIRSPAFIVQGSEWTFLFEIPKDVKPIKLTFAYPLQASKEQSSAGWYNLEIELGK